VAAADELRDLGEGVRRAAVDRDDAVARMETGGGSRVFAWTCATSVLGFCDGAPVA
jgi:hypothetical protein